MWQTQTPDHPAFCDELLTYARTHKIEMIIPGGDEDALALMATRERFEQEGILVAVQGKEFIPVFQSKTAQYEYLRGKGFSVPVHERVRTEEELVEALTRLGYPEYPIIMKPNFGRGGRGITLISEKIVRNEDNLPLKNQQSAKKSIDGKTEYILMRYMEGIVYDVDALRYKDGNVFLGVRKRLCTNVTKLFSGNMFDPDEAIGAFARKIYDAMPTEYLVDYDVMVDKKGSMELLEVNPRPSGSTISYLPFGINLYYVLAKSFLDNEHIQIEKNDFIGHSAHAFYTMIRD
ncbi:MAG: hypothetical protein UX17_C0077G0008 [Parcubacteria group bacterium GW2011_GWC2_45_7]|nr:MAG: hypothetical protein UX17_C0077G0008 [Parcubacteria group bacterium GW2011_GWC2_45_7]